jgi:putative transposase
MKKSKFSEKQILDILKEQDFGKSVAEISRAHNITPATFHNWKNKYAGMNEQELARLRELETENARLKQIVVNQSLDIQVM